MAIATLSQFKTYIGETGTDNDGLLNLFLNGANQLVETYIGRSIASDTYTIILNGKGQRYITLDNYPITDLASVEWNKGDTETQDWELIDPKKYALEEYSGTIFFSYPLNRGFQNYRVVYTGGYDEVPSDLVIAVLKLSSKWYNTKQSDGIRSETVNSDNLSYDMDSIPEDIVGILDGYKDFHV